GPCSSGGLTYHSPQTQPRQFRSCATTGPALQDRADRLEDLVGAPAAVEALHDALLLVVRDHLGRLGPVGLEPDTDLVVGVVGALDEHVPAAVADALHLR